MKILYRYIFTSILKPLLFSITAFFILWLIYDLFDTLPDFVNQTASTGLIFKFYLVQLPKIAQSVIPVAFLFTTLYVLAYMSSHRELIVMQANGLSLAKIAAPFFLIAAVLTVILFWLNFQLTPRAAVDRRLIKEQIQGKPSDVLVYHNVIYRNPETGALWYVQTMDARHGTLQNAEILIPDRSGRDQHKLVAAEGVFQNDYWNLAGVQWMRFDVENDAQPHIVEIPQMSAYELTDPPKQIVAALRPPDEMTWSELWTFINSSYRTSPTQMAPYDTENYYRMASPFICIVLCFFGIALGVISARHSVLASVFNCIFVLFTLLIWLQLSLALGGGARIPPFIAGWSGILTFGIVGFYLFADRVGWLWLWHAKLQKFRYAPEDLPVSTDSAAT